MSSEDMLLQVVLNREVEKLGLLYGETCKKRYKIFSEILKFYLDFKFNKNAKDKQNHRNIGENRN
jgi:hypothetical protein